MAMYVTYTHGHMYKPHNKTQQSSSGSSYTSLWVGGAQSMEEAQNIRAHCS